MSGFTISRLDRGDHHLVNSRTDTILAAFEHDGSPLPAPTQVALLSRLFQYRRDLAQEDWVAVADGAVVGVLTVQSPQLDNTHNMQLSLRVRPEWRGRGVGSALMTRAETRAGELGRTNLTMFVHRPSPDGPPFPDGIATFLTSCGYTPAVTMDLRYCDLDLVDEDRVEALWTDALARSEGFELVEFEGLPGPDLIDGIAHLHGRIFSDSPTGDWDVREIHFDADRLRDINRVQTEQGMTTLQVAAVHTASGEVAGITEIELPAGREGSADQGDTIVDTRFRGHRLGALMKIANQRRVRRWRPRVKHIWTGNAQDNAHMIGINKAIGYRPSALGALFQKELD